MDIMRLNFRCTTYEADDSWKKFFTLIRLVELDKISAAIGNDFTPPENKVLRFCEIDLSQIKVIVLGQDPYPQQDVATGRSFEVGDIKSWAELKRNASLVNILKLLHKNYLGADDVVGIAEIRADIASGRFPVLPPKKLFSYLEEQGVLFLNTALTCKIMDSGSHTEIWRGFTSELLKFISVNNPEAKWLLWGKDAQEFASFVPAGQKMTSYHPRLHDKKEGSFLGENHFAKCPEITWVE
ncbi:uracil-DNA glycosylase [Maridesulfovibrio hydrothermalis]|uniref:Uracil-DNA glycosylase n=1 Tax=Maridesulfovibrio hydrothermalis AM13 = DSM 14728 TaxID=1121451 RepID=L0R6W6_9BACT|nr:uracil-DNA glycosylase [Maridesulfovibrio hydrothermalis]CCO22458.1 Uracil-DNA glycosylase [Maridesulfovibrio hydrothermalis AM13 = DSM 14728]